jgi:hypothetical protein
VAGPTGSREGALRPGVLTTALAAALWAITVALLALLVPMKASGWNGAGNNTTSGLVALVLAFLAFATMGALVAARVPGNVLGWLFLVISLVAVLEGTAENYAYHAYVQHPGSLPAALPVAWFYAWGWYPTIILIIFVPLLYPSGTVPGPRWRKVVVAEIVFIFAITLLYMLRPGPLDGDKRLPRNPTGVGPLGWAADHLPPVLGLAAVVFLGLGLAALVVRFRRSSGDERQQIKIMAFAAGMVLGGIALSAAPLEGWSDVVTAVTIGLLPVAVGVAMLRYRLYDVDRVINKTLVYGALTAVLAAAYAGLVLASQALFSSFAGGSNLAIAVSTLLVAALFMPLRRRIQGFVDRRFYRSHYDAARTLERFTARLRDEVDLEVLNGDLLAVVHETVQPDRVSLWLRER